jgi:hypothetical protein
MFPSLWNAFQALLLALGIIWCKEIFPKWREHLQEFRLGSGADRTVLVVVWGLTVVILFFSIRFISGICGSIIRSLHDMM